MRNLRPWFDAQIAADRANETRLGAATSDAVEPPTGAAREKAALAACAFDDPVVMRARAQVRHLVMTADQAYGTEEVRTHLARRLDGHPEFTPTLDGPSRDEWESLTDQAPAPVRPRNP
ncbi:MAG: hypothetical protein QOI83_4055 [Streptomycetaceae bacterium]|nr:hypothetical protein [Streptomycetaceae bacterium]